MEVERKTARELLKKKKNRGQNFSIQHLQVVPEGLRYCEVTTMDQLLDCSVCYNR